MKNFGKTFVAAALLGMSSVAFAGGGALTLEDNGTGGLSDSFASAGLKGSFTDFWTFHVGTTSSFSASATTGTAMKGFFLELFKVGSPDASIGVSGVENGKSKEADLSIGSITAGDYKLAVTGEVPGKIKGSYAGEVTIAPVPEASTWAMMIAGVGLVGFAARRRQGKAA